MAKIFFKIWNIDRSIKKSFSCEPNVEKVIEKGKRYTTLNTTNNNCSKIIFNPHFKNEH